MVDISKTDFLIKAFI